MRHDVNPMEYLLDTQEYQSAIVLVNCTATLVAPRWILTAAHCVYPNSVQGSRPGHKLTLIDQTITISSIHYHPGFTQEEGVTKHDIALIELSEPSFSILPTPFYEGNNELGEVLKLAGYGVIGDGLLDIYDRCFPCDLRGADNVVEAANDHLISFRFDQPIDGNSLPLEGVGAGGDSGGPAFIETETGRYVAGVSSFGSRNYNEFDNYTRVSQELNWLVKVMASDYPGNYSGPLYSEVNQKTEDTSNSGGTFGFVIIISLMLLINYRIRLNN
jgi:secreted trypsin-like serine protease